MVVPLRKLFEQAFQARAGEDRRKEMNLGNPREYNRAGAERAGFQGGNKGAVRKTLRGKMRACFADRQQLRMSGRILSQEDFVFSAADDTLLWDVENDRAHRHFA